MLAFTLTAFLELMDHGIVSWDMVSITFIKQVRPPTFRLSSLRRQLSSRLEGRCGRHSCSSEGRRSIPEARCFILRLRPSCGSWKVYFVTLAGPALRRWNWTPGTDYGQSGIGLSVRLGIACSQPASTIPKSSDLLPEPCLLFGLKKKKKPFISFAFYLSICLLFTNLQGRLFDCQMNSVGGEKILLVLSSFLLEEGAVSPQKTELKPMNAISADLELHLSLGWDIENFPMLEILRHK